MPELAAAAAWSPHPTATPITTADGEGSFVTAANGSRTCCGGWQFEYTGILPGQSYALSAIARLDGIEHPRDVLTCTAHWARLPLDTSAEHVNYSRWDYLLPESAGGGTLRFARTARAPHGASVLVIRCTYRWATTGRAVWSTPQVAATEERVPLRRPVRIAVVTGHARSRPATVPAVRANVDHYGSLCESACRAWEPHLIVLPEVALQWGVRGHPLDLAVAAPGPETETFAQIARQYRVRLVIGMYERDGDAAYNSAILMAPDGTVDGRYRKVHLAMLSEALSGLRPGTSFPVFATEIGRIGCNICMDSSAVESARMVGLGGADVLALPIMGDHRADRWTPGPPIFNEERWRAIMRTRAMDNQLCLAVARNQAQGSCIVDRKGDILAWNEGDVDSIFAEADLDGDFRLWNGGCFRDVN